MYILLSLILLIVHIYITKKVKKRVFTVSTVYVAIWYICLAISSLGLYEIYIPSTSTYIICYANTVVFSIVSLLFGSVKNKKTNCDYIEEERYEPNNFIIIGLHIIAYLFSARYLVVAWNYIVANGIRAIRSVDVVTLNQSTSIVLIFQWILLPMFTITMIMAGIEFSKKRKISLLLVLSILDALLYGILYGGRYIFFKLALFLFVPSIIENSGGIKKFIQKYKKIFIVLVLCFIAIAYITKERSLSGFSFIGNVIGYYTGSIVFFDKLLETFETPLYYGWFIFGSPINFVSAVLKVLFRIPYSGSDQIFNIYTATGLRIGAHTIYNSLSTSLYYFVLDFGVYFSWIGTVLFAIACNYFEKKYYRDRKSLYLMIIYIFMIYCAFDSILKWNFLQAGNLLIFIIPVVMIKRKTNSMRLYYGTKNIK